MQIYPRNHYLKKVIPHIDKNIIKIITGMRRSGKSVILRQIKDYIFEKKKYDGRNCLLIDKELSSFNFINNHEAQTTIHKNL